MYDLQFDSIAQNTQEYEESRSLIRKPNSKQFCPNDRRKLQPWSQNCFQLTYFEQAHRNEQKNNFMKRNSDMISRLTRRDNNRKNSTYRSEQHNPAYRIDTKQEENFEQKIKWRLEMQFMKRKRKKTTQILKMKHYHGRSHTINPLQFIRQKKQEEINPRSTLNINQLYQNLKQLSRKNQISDRLKTTIRNNQDWGKSKSFRIHPVSGEDIPLKHSRKKSQPNVMEKKQGSEKELNENELSIHSMAKNISCENSKKGGKMVPRQSWNLKKKNHKKIQQFERKMQISYQKPVKNSISIIHFLKKNEAL